MSSGRSFFAPWILDENEERQSTPAPRRLDARRRKPEPGIANLLERISTGGNALGSGVGCRELYEREMQTLQRDLRRLPHQRVPQLAIYLTQRA